ncbi:MAG: hypothetical protein ACR2QT_01955 [Woeseiaceae bacterium]
MNKKILCFIGTVFLCMSLTPTIAAGEKGSDRAAPNSFWGWYSKDLYQTANVAGLFGLGGNSGAATLVRERNKISGRIMSFVPDAGLPYTLWIIVVNNPDACLDFLCLLGPNDDPLRPETRTTIFNGTGLIAPASGDGAGGGVFNADFAVESGRLPEGLFVLHGGQHALWRGNGHKALVWLVIDRHEVPDDGSWIVDLTETAEGVPNIRNVTLTVFPPCSNSSCPEAVPLAEILAGGP